MTARLPELLPHQSAGTGRTRANAAVFWVKISSLLYFQCLCHAQLATLTEQHSDLHLLSTAFGGHARTELQIPRLLFSDSMQKPLTLAVVYTFHQIQEQGCVKLHMDKHWPIYDRTQEVLPLQVSELVSPKVFPGQDI